LTGAFCNLETKKCASKNVPCNSQTKPGLVAGCSCGGALSCALDLYCTSSEKCGSQKDITTIVPNKDSKSFKW